jgi:hypothetical protein
MRRSSERVRAERIETMGNDGTRAHAIELLTSAIQNADDHTRSETRAIVATFVDALIETLQAPDAHAACRESRAEGERRKYLMGYEDGKRA